jgi:hypothetical protein
VVWFLKEVRLNCVTQGERDIDWWDVLISHIVHKEVEFRGGGWRNGIFLLPSSPSYSSGAREWGCGWGSQSDDWYLHWDSLSLGRKGWLRNHLRWVYIPNWDGKNHVR